MSTHIKVTHVPVNAQDITEAMAIAISLRDLTGNMPTVAQVDTIAHDMNQQLLGIGYEALFDPFMSPFQVHQEIVWATEAPAISTFDAQPIHIPPLEADALAIQLIGQFHF